MFLIAIEMGNNHTSEDRYTSVVSPTRNPCLGQPSHKSLLVVDPQTESPLLTLKNGSVVIKGDTQQSTCYLNL